MYLSKLSGRTWLDSSFGLRRPQKMESQLSFIHRDIQYAMAKFVCVRMMYPFH